MATNYPGSLDSFDTIASDKKTSDSVGGRTHRQMHNDVADALEAVQAELGTDPAGAFATVKARLDALVAYAAKTSAYTATVADHTLNVTSGTFTLDLPAASTCTGQSLKVKNSGTGVVTLDGNSSETVEGVATFPLGKGSYVEITSTGAAWVVTGGTPDTGWRNITTTLDSGFQASNTAAVVLLRRVGDLVHLHLDESTAGSATGTVTIGSLPAGFVSARTQSSVCINSSSGVPVLESLYVSGDPIFGFGWTAIRHQTELQFRTNATWPASLPGSAV